MRRDSFWFLLRVVVSVAALVLSLRYAPQDTLVVLFGLAVAWFLIVFKEPLGEYTGRVNFLTSGSIVDAKSPPFLFGFFGWVILLGLLAMSVLPALSNS